MNYENLSTITLICPHCNTDDTSGLPLEDGEITEIIGIECSNCNEYYNFHMETY